MQVIKSLFIENLNCLKKEQLTDYFIKDLSGKDLVISLNVPSNRFILDSVMQAFESCRFHKIDLIIKFSEGKILCKFINLNVLYYNPIRDNNLKYALSIKLNKFINQPKLLSERPYQLARINIKNIKQTDECNKKIKQDVGDLLLDIIDTYFLNLRIQAFVRIAAYSLDEEKIIFDITLVPNLEHHELFTDHL